MSPAKTTARLRRTQAQARFSDVVDDAMHSTKTKQSVVATTLGISTSKVQQWIDDELPHLPTLADIACMPKEVAHELLRALASTHDLMVIEAPSVEDTAERHIVRITECQREAAEANLVYLDAMADGKVSKAEARRIRKEHQDALEKNGEVIAVMDAIIAGECA